MVKDAFFVFAHEYANKSFVMQIVRHSYAILPHSYAFLPYSYAYSNFNIHFYGTNLVQRRLASDEVYIHSNWTIDESIWRLHANGRISIILKACLKL